MTITHRYIDIDGTFTPDDWFETADQKRGIMTLLSIAQKKKVRIFWIEMFIGTPSYCLLDQLATSRCWTCSENNQETRKLPKQQKQTRKVRRGLCIFKFKRCNLRLWVVRTNTKNFNPTETTSKYTVWTEQAFNCMRILGCKMHGIMFGDVHCVWNIQFWRCLTWNFWF